MTVKGIKFVEFISADSIREKVRELADEISITYKNREPVFLPVLNGSFIFAADILKETTIPCHVSFVKTTSYQGTTSTGQHQNLIGINEDLSGRHVIIVEDIVDTGLTLSKIIDDLKGLKPASIEVVALLRKRPAREKGVSVRFVGFDIDDEFVLGYGLDLDGLGRNYPAIFKALQ